MSPRDPLALPESAPPLHWRLARIVGPILVLLAAFIAAEYFVVAAWLGGTS